MKSFFSLLAGILFVFMMAGTAIALPVTLVDTTLFTATGTTPGGDLDDNGWGDINKLDGIGDYVAWTHHFVFDPAADELLNGTLTLSLRDDSSSFWDGWELAFGWTESGEWDFGDIDTGDYAYSVDVVSLADGSFSVILASAGGDFYIDSAKLSIDYNPVPEPVTDPVPEPATVLLFGLGILGFTGVVRKKLKK